MQRVLGVCLLSLAAAAYSQAQATTTTSGRSKSTAASSTSSTANRKTTTAHARSTAITSKAGTRGRAVKTRGRRTRGKPGPTYQLHPDPARYQQIQQALSDRGYFKGQVNGEWGDDSVEALKKFQADQKLDTDGKINSLSLIGLGLGPKHDGTSGHDAPVPPAPSPESPLAAPQTSDPQTQSPPPTPPN